MGNNHPKGPGRANVSPVPRHHGGSSSSASAPASSSSSPARNPPPPPTIDPRHLQPQGNLYAKNGVSKSALAKVILDGQLACCKPGSSDEIPGAEECPICFLWYEVGLNRSACCRKGLCTECFLQMNIQEVSGGLLGQMCPFCNHTPFSVTFEGALSPEFLREQSLEQERISASAELCQQETLRRLEEAQEIRKEEAAVQRKARLLEQAQTSTSCNYVVYPPLEEGGETRNIISADPSVIDVLDCIAQWEASFSRIPDVAEEQLEKRVGVEEEEKDEEEEEEGGDIDASLSQVFALAESMPRLPPLDDFLRKARRQRERQHKEGRGGGGGGAGHRGYAAEGLA